MGVARGVMDFKAILRATQWPRSEYASTVFQVLTGKGKEVLRSPPSGLPESLGDEEVLKPVKGQKGTFRTGTGEEERIFSYARSTGYGGVDGSRWVVLVSQDMGEVMGPGRLLRSGAMGLSAAFIALSLTVFLLISRSTRKPIQRLIEDTKVIGQGDLDHEVEVDKKTEIGLLARAYQALARDLKEMTTSRDRLAEEMAERRRAERAAQEALEESERLREQLAQAQRLEAIGRLASGVAHDFNNLLTTIIGNTDLILMTLDKGSALAEEVQEIKKAADSAASLTRQLLAFSRRQVLQPRVLDLNQVLGDMEKMLRRLIGEDIELLTVLEAGLGRVKADPGQVEQVILNLAVNARDAMPGGGKLTIETANMELDEAYSERHLMVRPGPYVMLAVSDTGEGMDQQTLSQVFEPFFTTKERGKGTGLGLSTVYGIVKQSGGYVWAYSEPGQGATFKVYLPRVEAEVEPGPEEREVSGPLRGSETVLVVEDNDMVRDLTKNILSRHGYRVLEAKDGAEALKISHGHEENIDLLLTDVVMPGMSGTELAAGLRSVRPDLRVLYMSGYTNNSVVHHGVLDRETVLLQKPFSGETLLRKIREVLED